KTSSAASSTSTSGPPDHRSPTAASTCASVAYNASLRIRHVGTLPGDYMVSLGRLRLLGHRFRACVPIPPPPTVHRSFRTLQAVAGGSSALVKSLLQALIPEVRVDSRQAIHPVFRIPVGGDHQQDDAVRAPSRSVEVNGLEPSASTLRT